MVQVVTTLVFRTPRLQECDRGSIMSAVMRTSSLGLDLEPSACEAYLVPRYNKYTGGQECQFQPGYQGLRKLAMRTGRYALVEARLVYERDIFLVAYEPDLVMSHTPHLGEDRGRVLYAYGFAKQANGERQVKVLNVREIEESHHQRSESYRTAQRKGKPEEGPWVTDWAEMARKSALIALCKDLEKSHELIEALASEFEIHRDEDGGPAVLVRRSGGGSRSEALYRQLDGPPPEPTFEPGTPGVIRSEADPGDFYAPDPADAGDPAAPVDTGREPGGDG